MTGGARRSFDPRAVLTPTDPNHHLLHRSVRVAVVFPAIVAVGLYGLHQPQFTLIGAYGAFGALGLVDLGGGVRQRARAHLVITALGVVLVAAASLASPWVGLAAAVMFVGAFALQLSAVFGGFFSAGEPALLLPFVIAVIAALPAPTGESLLWREVGWLTAGLAATAAVTWWWPESASRQVGNALAAAARAIAQVVEQPPERPLSTEVDGALDELRRTREAFLRDPNHPSGPSRHDQAIVVLLDELTRAIQALKRWHRPRAPGIAPEVDAAHDALASQVAATFDAAAVALERSTPLALDLRALDRCRTDHLAALERWTRSAATAGATPAQVLHVVDDSFPLRVLSYAALNVAANTAIAVGAPELPDRDAPSASVPDAEATRTRGLAILTAHLHPGSVWFRNSLRAAVGLTLALVVARLGQFDNAFWVVLGTLAVLRSNAAGTGRSAVQAVAGNIVGVLVAAGLVAVSAGQPALLWPLLVLGVFLAAYTPAAIHFAVGQASFSVMVVVLYALIQPEQVGTTVIRITDVATGVAVGVVVAAFFWPRGASGRLRRSLATLWDADAVAVARGATAVLAVDVAGPGVDAPALPVARADAEEAFRQYLAERGAKRVANDQWARLYGVGTALRVAADSLERLVDTGLRVDPAHLAGDASGSVPSPSAPAVVATAWSRRATDIAASADQLRGVPPGPVPLPPPTDVEQALRAALGEGELSADAVAGFLGLVFAAEWIRVVDHLVAEAADPIRQVREVSATPWWR